MNDYFELVKEGIRLLANLGLMALGTIKSAVLGYFRQVKVWTIRFAIAAAAPLLIVIPSLMLKLPWSGFYGAYIVWIVLLVAAELLLLTPMFLVWRRLKTLFPNVAAEFQEWLDFIKTVVFNGLSLGIFVTLFPIWRSPGAFPLLLLILACWVTLPACGVSTFLKRIYPAVRAIQLLVLFGLLVLQMAFPRHMEQMQWASNRLMGGVLTSSVQQKDITAEWKTVRWFNNTGEPQVWYSGTAEVGYRLWAAPGFDDKTGEKLNPVGEQKTRDLIVDHFSESEHARQRADEAKSAAKAEKLLADSVNRSLIRAGAALIVIVDAKDQPVQELMDRIASRLTQAGRDTQSQVLTPAFYSTPLARELVSRGPADVLPKLGLVSDRIILGRVSITPNAPDNNRFITTDCAGVLTVFSASGKLLGTVRLNASAATRDKTASETMALNKAVSGIDWEKLIELLSQ